MFYFGQFDNEFREDLLIQASTQSQDLALIIQALSELKAIWKEDSDFFNKAFSLLKFKTDLNEKSILETLKIMPEIFDEKNLLERIKGDFSNLEVLDSFAKESSFKANVFVSPLGKLLHVSAGNVFLGVLDSLIMGLLTKNINIVKVGSRNEDFVRVFCESLMSAKNKEVLLDKIAFISWKGGDEELEKKVLSHVDGVILWGGQEAIDAYRKKMSFNQKLISFGPKVSFGVIYQDFVSDELYPKIAMDTLRWKQAACSNAQIYFVHEAIDPKLFIKNLYKAFNEFEEVELNIGEDEQVERLMEINRSKMSSFKTGVDSLYNENFILHFLGDSSMSFSILNQSLKIISFKDIKDLKRKIKPFSSYLQTCALGTFENRKILLTELSNTGIKRFTTPGKMTQGGLGVPHDGKYALRELVHFIVDESLDDFDFTVKSLQKNQKALNQVISDQDLKNKKISKSKDFLNPNMTPGPYFASGGSTGEPKYCSYSYDDFDKVSGLLSENFKDLGLCESDVVANLFMAGNMWSSFLSIYKTLEKVNCYQLPIGGLVSDEDAIKFIMDFSANVLIGVPTKISSILKYFIDHNINHKIDRVFYAGERFSDEQFEYIKSHFDCEIFSAGFACVDTGIIGIQSQDCYKDEHILLEGVEVEQVGDKQVLKSTLRSNMPVINYELSDKLIFDKNNPRKFRLSGRVDRVIQLWGCRFGHDDLQKALNNTSAQFKISKDNKLIINICASEQINFTKNFYEITDDVRKTINFEEFKSKLVFETKDYFVNPKTGKTPLVIDERF